MENKISIGVWKTKSEKGTEYYRGAKNGIEINGKKYRVSVFINSDKRSDKSPDMTISLNEQSNDIPQSTKTNYDNESSDIKIDEKDLPF